MKNFPTTKSLTKRSLKKVTVTMKKNTEGDQGEGSTESEKGATTKRELQNEGLLAITQQLGKTYELPFKSILV